MDANIKSITAKDRIEEFDKNREWSSRDTIPIDFTGLGLKSVASRLSSVPHTRPGSVPHTRPGSLPAESRIYSSVTPMIGNPVYKSSILRNLPPATPKRTLKPFVASSASSAADDPEDVEVRVETVDEGEELKMQTIVHSESVEAARGQNGHDGVVLLKHKDLIRKLLVHL